MAETEVPGGGATRGRGWFSGEKKLIQKNAIRKSTVCLVEYFPPKKTVYLFFCTVLCVCSIWYGPLVR